MAVKALEEGNVVAIPTETVYGLAGNAFSEAAVEKIYSLKQRPFYNPLIVHIKAADFLAKVARDVPDAAIKLANEFWPGPLTLVLKKQKLIPDIVTSGKDTVAVRMPNHPLTLKLLEQLDFPLAAPSANPFGSISPTSASHVHNYFKEELEVILDGGECERGIESTIIGFEEDQPVVYRLGSLSIEDIEDRIGNVFTKTRDDSSPVAPGMLSRHYAPTTETHLAENIGEFIQLHSGKKIGLLLFQHQVDDIPQEHQVVLSKSGNLKEAAKNLYAAMHLLDSLNLDIIIAEKFPDVGLGKTINDKLQRAAKK
ncbi:L-threonylcarbamoyladenylate synthase [Pontibacter cellulosilyticus]|nr:L-threonylcarbamoyladenylate synthase [Pontibacter cellulosilyticus]